MHKSPLDLAAFKECEKVTGEEAGGLTRANDTRWDSSLDCVGAHIDKWKTIEVFKVSKAERVKQFKFTLIANDDFPALEQVYGALAPIKWGTKILQACA
jgi:hypothetical protein